MEDTRRQCCIGLTVQQHLGKMSAHSRTAGSDHRNLHSFAHRAVSSQSKPARVPSASIEVSSISPAPRDSASFAQSRALRPVAFRPPSTNTSAPSRDRRRPIEPSRVNRDNDSLRSEACADLVDQLRPAQRGRVHADLVSTSVKDRRCVVQCPHPAAHREGNKQSLRRSSHRIEQRSASFVRCRDIQQNDFVCAGFCVTARQFRGIAGIDQYPRTAHPLPRGPRYIETGNNAFRQRQAAPRSSQNLQAHGPGFLRMELDAHDIVALYGRRERLIIFCNCNCVIYYRCAIGVREINKTACRHATQQRE